MLIKRHDRRKDGAPLTVRTFAEPAIYLLPFLLVVSVFMIFPILSVFVSAFYEGYSYTAGTYTSLGIANFRALFADAAFRGALANTFTFVGCVVPCTTCIGLFFAVQLNKKVHLYGFFQFAFFLPMITSLVAIGLVWRWMLHSDYGLINYFLSLFGAEPINWLNDPSKAKIALIIYGIWNKVPITILLFLAGLQTIDPQYYVAAKVDGASPAKMFRRITLPLLSPTIGLVLIINVINTSKVFNEIFILFNGKPGPAYSLYSVVFYIYEYFYKRWEVGIACAAALVLFLIVFLLTLFQVRIQKKWHY